MFATTLPIGPWVRRQTEPPRICLPVLLPPQEGEPRKTLVLDLDRTLIDCIVLREPSISEPDFVYTDDLGTQAKVWTRPFLRQFLAAVARDFEVVLFTAAGARHADCVLNSIDPKRTVFTHRLYGQHTTEASQWGWVKDLSRLGRDLASTLLIDDSQLAGLLQPCNLVPIRPFIHSNPKKDWDTALSELLRFLQDKVLPASDVRQAIAMHWNKVTRHPRKRPLQPHVHSAPTCSCSCHVTHHASLPPSSYLSLALMRAAPPPPRGPHGPQGNGHTLVLPDTPPATPPANPMQSGTGQDGQTNATASIAGAGLAAAPLVGTHMPSAVDSHLLPTALTHPLSVPDTHLLAPPVPLAHPLSNAAPAPPLPGMQVGGLVNSSGPARLWQRCLAAESGCGCNYASDDHAVVAAAAAFDLRACHADEDDDDHDAGAGGPCGCCSGGVWGAGGPGPNEFATVKSLRRSPKTLQQLSGGGAAAGLAARAAEATTPTVATSARAGSQPAAVEAAVEAAGQPAGEAITPTAAQLAAAGQAAAEATTPTAAQLAGVADSVGRSATPDGRNSNCRASAVASDDSSILLLGRANNSLGPAPLLQGHADGDHGSAPARSDARTIGTAATPVDSLHSDADITAASPLHLVRDSAPTWPRGHQCLIGPREGATASPQPTNTLTATSLSESSSPNQHDFFSHSSLTTSLSMPPSIDGAACWYQGSTGPVICSGYSPIQSRTCCAGNHPPNTTGHHVGCSSGGGGGGGSAGGSCCSSEVAAREISEAEGGMPLLCAHSLAQHRAAWAAAGNGAAGRHAAGLVMAGRVSHSDRTAPGSSASEDDGWSSTGGGAETGAGGDAGLLLRSSLGSSVGAASDGSGGRGLSEEVGVRDGELALATAALGVMGKGGPMAAEGGGQPLNKQLEGRVRAGRASFPIEQVVTTM